MKDTLLLELATTWELQAETGGDGLNRLDPKACESLRACADTLRMLVSTQPATPPSAEAGKLPVGWVPLTITHEAGYPEDAAYGPQHMMDRLKKWLDRHFERVVAERNAPPAAQVDPIRSHVEAFAKAAGWIPGDKEGAFEFIQRISYHQGVQDGRKEAIHPHRDTDPDQPKLTSKYDSSVPLHQQQSTREGLLAYVLQDDSNNCLTPRIVDIAYSAFMSGASGKNKDDGGRCDWFNDTKPMVAEAIKKIEKDLEEAKPANVDDYGLYWRGEYQRVVRQHDDFLKDSAEDRKLLAECLGAFKNVLHFRVTGEGRPPEQTTQDVVKRLNQTLGHWPRSE